MSRRLALSREPLAELTPSQLAGVAGGITAPNCWGPMSLIPDHIVPEPAQTFRCPPSGHC